MIKMSQSAREKLDSYCKITIRISSLSGNESFWPSLRRFFRFVTTCCILCQMIKLSSMLLAQLHTTSTELPACSRSSLWKPKSATLTGTTTYILCLLFLVVYELVFEYALSLVSLPGVYARFLFSYLLNVILRIVKLQNCLSFLLVLRSRLCSSSLTFISNVLVCILCLSQTSGFCSAFLSPLFTSHA